MRRRIAFLALFLANRRRKRALAGSNEEELSVPDAPTNLFLAVGAFDFMLTWEYETNVEEGFRVYRSSFGEPFDLVAELAANEFGCIDAGIEPGVIYTYYVVAFNAAGESAASNQMEGEIESGA